MRQYLDLISNILKNGEDTDDRTGVGTRSIFGHQMRFNLKDGFPAVSTKKLAFKAVISELLWFLEGSEDERRLAEITFEDDRENLKDKKTIWTANAYKQALDLGYPVSSKYSYLGPIYGYQWRNFNSEGVDQIKNIIHELKENPCSRRIILTAWNPAQLEEMALPPCHVLCQFRVQNNELSAQVYQRSADVFLGVPFNIASYALLTHILASISDLTVKELIWVGGDCHIYNNHKDQVLEVLTREPRNLPELKMPKFRNLEDVLDSVPSDYELLNYHPMEQIKAEMAV